MRSPISFQGLGVSPVTLTEICSNGQDNLSFKRCWLGWASLYRGTGLGWFLQLTLTTWFLPMQPVPVGRNWSKIHCSQRPGSPSSACCPFEANVFTEGRNVWEMLMSVYWHPVQSDRLHAGEKECLALAPWGLNTENATRSTVRTSALLWPCDLQCVIHTQLDECWFWCKLSFHVCPSGILGT